MKKKLKAYDKYQIDSAREVSGIYRFPGEFLILGLIALMIDLLIEHPIVTPEMRIVAVILFVMEACFLFKRYVVDRNREEE